MAQFPDTAAAAQAFFLAEGSLLSELSSLMPPPPFGGAAEQGAGSMGQLQCTLAALGETDRAREALDTALAADPNNAEALDALFQAGWRHGDVKPANIHVGASYHKLQNSAHINLLLTFLLKLE